MLRLLLSYGQERIMAPVIHDDDSVTEEETSLAELMFELLAMDDILFDEPIFREIYLDYRHTKNIGEDLQISHYLSHENESWRRTAIDLLAERHVLSPNWKDRHKIHVKRESEALFNALEEAIDILKERRVDRMLVDLDKKLPDSSYEDQLIILAEKNKILPIKLKLSKKTGRVIVG